MYTKFELASLKRLEVIQSWNSKEWGDNDDDDDDDDNDDDTNPSRIIVPAEIYSVRDKKVWHISA